MKLNLIREARTLTVAMEGRLDVKTSREVEEALEGKLDGLDELVFDFAEVTYISSAGLRLLAACQDAMDEAGARMRVVHVGEFVMKVFDMTHFTDVIDMSQ